MLQQLFLASLLAAASISTGSAYSIVPFYQPLAKVGDLVEHLPTAVSHQSSTIVHNSEPHVTPLLAPAVRSYAMSLVPSPGFLSSWSYPQGAALVYSNARFYRK